MAFDESQFYTFQSNDNFEKRIRVLKQYFKRIHVEYSIELF